MPEQYDVLKSPGDPATIRYTYKNSDGTFHLDGTKGKATYRFPGDGLAYTDPLMLSQFATMKLDHGGVDNGVIYKVPNESFWFFFSIVKMTASDGDEFYRLYYSYNGRYFQRWLTPSGTDRFKLQEAVPDPPPEQTGPTQSTSWKQLCPIPGPKLGPTTTAPSIPSSFQLVGLSDWFWENGSTLRIHFLDGDASAKQKVRYYATEWTLYANLKFEFFDDPNQPPVSGGQNVADIAVHFWNEGGGNSYYGTSSREFARKGQPSMNLNVDPSKGLILHEFGHALGFGHEHQSPVASINWNKDAVRKYTKDKYGWDDAKTDDNIINPLKYDRLNHSQFDRDSIMMYIIPKEWTNDGTEYSRKGELSDMDKQWVAKVYPLANRCPKCKGIGEIDAINPFPGGAPPLVPFQYCDRCGGSGQV